MYVDALMHTVTYHLLTTLPSVSLSITLSDPALADDSPRPPRLSTHSTNNPNNPNNQISPISLTNLIWAYSKLSFSDPARSGGIGESIWNVFTHFLLINHEKLYEFNPLGKPLIGNLMS